MTELENLRAWLAGLSAEKLEQTLLRRPDVLWGAPVRDLGELAERLMWVPSVAAVVRDLPAPALQALEVLSAVGAGASPERAAAVLDPRAFGRDDAAHRDSIGRCVRVLEEVALIWPGDAGGLELNPAVHEVIPYPLGVGRPAGQLLADASVADLRNILQRWGLPAPTPARKAELLKAVQECFGDETWVRKLVGAAPAEVAQVLVNQATAVVRRANAVHAGDGDLFAPDERLEYYSDREAFAVRRAAVTWAQENGLGYSPYGPYARDIDLPSEAVLALVGTDFRAPFTPVPPAVATAPVTADQAYSSAAGAITEFMGTAMTVLEAASHTPLTMLKSGGVGARELAKVAKSVGCGVGDVRLVVELALWLHLVEPDRDGGLGTSPAFDEWRRLAPARRAADLLAVWFGLDYVPTADRDVEGRSLPALSRFGGPDRTRGVRRLMLRRLELLDVGVGATSVDSVAGALAWRLPLVMSGDAGAVLRATWTEAERLGVLAHGRMSAIGESLLAADDARLLETVDAMLPAVQTTALFGSDLTVIVPGSPDPRVVDLLDSMAVREGRGAASTWRVTPESVRGALDSGHLVPDLLDRLGALTDGSLPQALEYLIHDVGRRHGHARVRPARAIVTSDDAALLAEIVVHRALRGIGLQRIAPTVLVAAVAPAEVVAKLRAAGYLPLELDADGQALVRLAPRRPEPPATGRRNVTIGFPMIPMDDDGDGEEAAGFDPLETLGMRHEELPSEVAQRLLGGRWDLGDEPPTR